MGYAYLPLIKFYHNPPQNTGIPKSRAIFIGEFYDQPVACSRGSHFLKKLIWVTTNWPAGPQQNQRVQVWRKFLRNNDFNHLRSIWKSQIDLELISRCNIEAEENWEPLWTQKCPQKASSPPKLGRRNALQIGVATVNLRMAVTPVRSLATTMRRLAPRTWAGHVGQASWPGYEGCHWQWWELLYSKGHFTILNG